MNNYIAIRTSSNVVHYLEIQGVSVTFNFGASTIHLVSSTINLDFYFYDILEMEVSLEVLRAMFKELKLVPFPVICPENDQVNDQIDSALDLKITKKKEP